MSSYKLKENILEQVIIENDKAICKLCGAVKPIRGIATHIFRKHTEKGTEHTEKVKNNLASYVKESAGQCVECGICNKQISILSISQHKIKCIKELEFKHQVLNKTCAACGKAIEEVIGRGIYCSLPCSKGRHARPDLEVKNEKIKETFAKKRLDALVDIECQNCKKIIKVSPKRRNRKFCSRKCQVSTPEHSAAMTKIIRRHIESGAPYPKGIKCVFTFNDKPIRCDSKLEWICLKWLTESCQIKDITRSDLWLAYTLDNFNRRHNPDFKITLENGNVVLVEAKMHQSETTRHNFEQYQKESHIKKQVLEEYCKSNNFDFIWFTQKTDSKFYRKACIEFDNTVRNNTL
jgi:endogenous inhibitor of DNA gyrase (YacG/DUF329 family)